MPVQLRTQAQRRAALLLLMFLAMPPPTMIHFEQMILFLFVFVAMPTPDPLLSIRHRLFYDQAYLWQGRDVFAAYIAHPHEFFLVTSETKDSFLEMLQNVRDLNVFRARGICLQNRLMMVFIRLRSYLCYATLSLMFDVPRPTVAYIIESMIQSLHALYAGSVRWSMRAEWTTMRGRWRDMPLVVGMVDLTPHRIYKPLTERESLYYSGQRHFHCMHTQVVVDNYDVLRYIKTGFMGHNNDAITFRLLSSIGPNAELDFPGDCYLIADKMHPSRYPLLTPCSAAQIYAGLYQIVQLIGV